VPPEAVLKVQIHVGQGGGRELSIDVSFEAPPGVTILFGPSGAGKSTTLQAVAGILRPERGRISLGDEVWFDSDSHTDVAIEKRSIAYVFQSLALFPHMSGLGNVEYGIDRRVPRDERRKRAGEMLERMRVSHLAHRRPSTFSGGEAQRVALARAFARAPRLVLLDEPFSALDRELRRDFVEDVRSYIEEARIPLVHVTHHRNEARILGQRIVLLEAGQVKATGDVDKLLPPSSAMDESMPVEISRGGGR
jgi:molybdate transport system ATP-binding protein